MKQQLPFYPRQIIHKKKSFFISIFCYLGPIISYFGSIFTKPSHEEIYFDCNLLIPLVYKQSKCTRSDQIVKPPANFTNNNKLSVCYHIWRRLMEIVSPKRMRCNNVLCKAINLDSCFGKFAPYPNLEFYATFYGFFLFLRHFFLLIQYKIGTAHCWTNDNDPIVMRNKLHFVHTEKRGKCHVFHWILFVIVVKAHNHKKNKQKSKIRFVSDFIRSTIAAALENNRIKRNENVKKTVDGVWFFLIEFKKKL